MQMENRKPIKRDAAIIELSKDHHFALLLIWKIREGLKKSIEPFRISRYVVHFFDTDLIQHFREEEEILFTKIPQENKLIQEAFQHHRDIKQLVDDMKKNPGDRTLPEKFADRLEKHIRFEERELFNYIQETISESSLKEIGSSLSSRQHEPDGAWNDIFWENTTSKK